MLIFKWYHYGMQFDDNLQKSKVSELHHREEEALVSTLAPKYGYPYIDLKGLAIDSDALTLISEADAKFAEVALFAKSTDTLSIAIRNPKNPETLEMLDRVKNIGLTPHVYMVSLSSLEYAWSRYGDIKNASAVKRGILDVDADSILLFQEKIHSYLDVASLIANIQHDGGKEQVTQIIGVLFGGALALNASDVHIEPESLATRIRFRLDGVLWDTVEIPKSLSALIVSRFKLLSGLKLNIRNEAQDGRFTFDIGDRKIEVRTSVIPGGYGESIVMRLLDPGARSFKLEYLNFGSRLREVVAEELKRPNGAIVTTGPTGSGKTTALYAFLQAVHTPEVKIITIEDPVEYKLPGIVQTQVSDNYSFAAGLRAVLRQDPDVIMVGEIRDREVAETVVHAALTGHLVFSTLHTNSAVGAFPRLINLGVDSRMIGSAFNLILGQRLVRKLCEACRVSRDANTEEQKLIARIMEQPVALQTVYEAAGCDACGHSGYKGRMGIYEAVMVDKAVEEAIVSDSREENIRMAAKPQGIPTLQQDGVMKALAGFTSLDELARVVDLYGIKNELGEGF